MSTRLQRIGAHRETQGRMVLLTAVRASTMSTRQFAMRVLDVRERTLRRWLAGTSPVPPGVLEQVSTIVLTQVSTMTRPPPA